MTIREALAHLTQALEQFEDAEGHANEKIAILAEHVDPFDGFILWLQEAAELAAKNFPPEDDDNG
tara:strand:+ start:2591 stop:2785 length:195 start_codon:yes stop_codon:yes gene_type:complete